MRRPAKSLGDAALGRLVAHPWPGNVRELENEMKRLAVLAPGRSVDEADLSESIRSPGRGGPYPAVGATSSAAAHGRSLARAVEALERRLIGEALAACEGNQVHTARALGLSRQGLIKKLERYGLRVPARRGAPRRRAGEAPER